MPSLTTILLGLAIALLVYLLGYSFAFLALSLALLLPRRARRLPPQPQDRGSVVVLVPAHHEGPGLVDAVRTILKQDYLGPIEIRVLVQDLGDSSVPMLREAFPAAPALRKRGESLLLAESNRRVVLVATGVSSKRDKLNDQLPRLEKDFIAILDADHRASHDWLSSAFGRMDEEKASVVQSRRRPLAITGLTQLWDAAQAHLGNEALNAVLHRAGRSVFFTGTTAVFRASVLQERRFADCVTEDTWLAMDLLLDGERIAFDGESGSYEEVAPTLKGYLARRRRWSAGHTKVFANHLRAILSSPLSRGEKLQLLIYGQFYFIPVAIGLFFGVQALFLLLQFPGNLQILVALATLLAAWALVLLGSSTPRHRLSDLVVAMLWTFPYLTMLALVSYRHAGLENYHYLLAFPYAEQFLAVQLASLFLPLLPVVIGWARLGVLHPLQLGLLILSSPLMLFFDVLGCLWGASDLLAGRALWSKIARDNAVSASSVPEALRGQLGSAKRAQTRWIELLWVPAAALFVILANDLMAKDKCGETTGFLWAPLLWHPGHPVKMDLHIDRKASEKPGFVDVVVRSSIEARSGSKLERVLASYRLDGGSAQERVVELSGDHSDQVSWSFPFGWESHQIEVSLRAEGLACHRTAWAATSLVELRGGALYVNGEKFLVKGLIPSFSTSQLNLPVSEGLAEIKATGANVVRLYHAPSDAFRKEAAKAGLLLVDQPNESTWETVNLESTSSRDALLSRYQHLLAENEGYPYQLMNNLGNELELGSRSSKTVSAVAAMLQKAATLKQFPLSYSTYLTYANYPVDVLGINMLDSSETYWGKALALLQSYRRPFYATELGGFVAYTERTSSELRIARIHDQWQRLLAAGGLGACFFQSHDNWAQPVPPGAYNDPFSPDQPDDTRGFWDHLNHPKLELGLLRALFSDVELRAVAAGRVAVRNRREYRLVGLEATLPDGSRAPLGDLAPGEERELSLPGAGTHARLSFRYTTHAGLPGSSTVNLPLPFLTDRPLVLEPDFVAEASQPESISGRLLYSPTLTVAVPASWTTVKINGERQTPVAGRLQLPVQNPYLPVEGLSWSSDGASWRPFSSGKIGAGRTLLRFRLPRLRNTIRSLILEGLGASHFQLRMGDEQRTVPAQQYRETVIDLAPLGERASGAEITIEVLRDQLVYIDGHYTPDGKNVEVELSAPRVFSPLDVKIER